MACQGIKNKSAVPGGAKSKTKSEATRIVATSRE
jgi:hypothetical protein